MYLKVNDFSCIRGRISLPLTGAWTADLSIDPATSASDLPIFGSRVTLSLGEGDFTLAGTVKRVNNAFDVVYMRLIGGAGGLTTQLQPKDYQNVTFGLVLSDVLSQCGETLSQATPAAVQGIQLPFWTIPLTQGFQALAELVSEASVQSGGDPVNWRVLPDGTIFVGVEQWPDATMATFDQMSWSPHQLSTRIFSENPSVTPGEVWQSAKVTDVAHRVDPETSRAEIFFQDQEPG